jgi:RND family efflux transporter MFP subunit
MTETNQDKVPVVRLILARLRFVAVFVIAGLIVGYWETIKNYYEKWTRPAVTLTDEAIEFTCAMHPDIVRSEPGNCPICGMPLTRREKGAHAELPEGVLARVQLTPQRIALAGIQTSLVEYRALTREIRTVGSLDYDETKLARLTARVAGRVDELFVTFTGQNVKQGEPVYSIYSPDVYAAQREYLQARQRVHSLPEDAAADLKSDAAAVYNATQQKLVLWGVSPQQLDKLDKDYDATGAIPTHLIVASPITGVVTTKNVQVGQYLQLGEVAYSVADLSTLWLQAKVFEQDISLISLGQSVDVKVDSYPTEKFAGRVAFMATQLDPTTRTLDARVEVDNSKGLLKPGMFATAVVHASLTSTQPATAPSTRPEVESSKQRTYLAALKPYLQAQSLLASDKSDDVSKLLHDSLKLLDPIASDTAIKDQLAKLTAAVHETMGENLEATRKTFKQVSVAMIEIGKLIALPADSEDIRIYRCPMTDKPYWLQISGETRNPYYGSQMLTCGGPVQPLPRATEASVPATQPSNALGKVLAVPRSAVIQTGERSIVYVETAKGIYDMRGVTLGPASDELYPVLEGLNDGDRVVTNGAFLVDAENRLNPSK